MFISSRGRPSDATSGVSRLGDLQLCDVRVQDSATGAAERQRQGNLGTQRQLAQVHSAPAAGGYGRAAGDQTGTGHWA